ncbi:MAG: hydantoinase B/oxoprolinase family protein [Gammaproteobacteria bacterium]|nr:hydantoinase B/oxoprolinase family protein [Gammaproteobacteria bacterium]
MVDSITVEVIRHSLLASANEMARNLCRTAYNTVVYEIHDYGIGLHDAEGNVVADTPGIAIFTGGNDFGVQKTIEFLGMENLHPGDVILLNYPYWSCAHTLDALVLAPIFVEDSLLAFASCRVHLLDLKQKDAGYVLDSTSMYQEGIFFPAVKLYNRGVLNEDIVNIIKFNSRMPERTLGDLQAEVSAVQTGERRVREIAAKYGADTVAEAMQEINDHGERLARAALAKLPKGSWSAFDYCDSDGIDLDEMIKMEVTVTVTDEKMVIDWSKTDKPAKGPINLPRGMTMAATMMAFKSLTTPDTPVCAGNFRPLEVITKPGSLMEAVPPMPTFTLWPGLLAAEVVTKALAKGMPDIVPACTGGDVCDVMALGTDPRSGAPWLEATNDAVGFGGHAGGDGEDGIMHITEPGCRNNPIEVLETKAPLLIERYGYRPDSGGPGKHRGGVGVERAYRFLAPASAIVINFKTRTRPWAIGEGETGLNNTVVVNPGTDDEKHVGVSYNHFDAEGRIVNLTGGGGGWGNPFERDPLKVAADVRMGLVTADHAAAAYGVVVDPETFDVNVDATTRLRDSAEGKGE